MRDGMDALRWYHPCGTSTDDQVKVRADARMSVEMRVVMPPELGDAASEVMMPVASLRTGVKVPSDIVRCRLRDTVWLVVDDGAPLCMTSMLEISRRTCASGPAYTHLMSAPSQVLISSTELKMKVGERVAVDEPALVVVVPVVVVSCRPMFAACATGIAPATPAAITERIGRIAVVLLRAASAGRAEAEFFVARVAREGFFVACE